MRGAVAMLPLEDSEMPGHLLAAFIITPKLAQQHTSNVCLH